MEDNLNSTNPENGEVIQQNGEDTTTVVQPTQVVNEEDYKNLQAFATQNRQALIESTKKLVEKDGSELHNIADPKLRDSVSKMLFNMGYAEAEAVFGK